MSVAQKRYRKTGKTGKPSSSRRRAQGVSDEENPTVCVFVRGECGVQGRTTEVICGYMRLGAAGPGIGLDS